MILHIIWDDRRPEKLPLLQTEMLRQGISYTLWSAEIMPNVVESINASHRKIVKHAKLHNMECCAIAEDDVCFPHPTSWRYFLGGLPLCYDLYLAGCYSRVITHDHERYTVSPVGLHCYIIHNCYYDKFLNSDPLGHIDTLQTRGTFKVCYPFAAIQRPGWSSNNGKNVNYNELLTDADVYGGIPKL